MLPPIQNHQSAFWTSPRPAPASTCPLASSYLARHPHQTRDVYTPQHSRQCRIWHIGSYPPLYRWRSTYASLPPSDCTPASLPGRSLTSTLLILECLPASWHIFRLAYLLPMNLEPHILHTTSTSSIPEYLRHLDLQALEQKWFLSLLEHRSSYSQSLPHWSHLMVTFLLSLNTSHCLLCCIRPSSDPCHSLHLS